MKKAVIIIFINIFLLFIMFQITKQPIINLVQIPEETVFRLACDFHGIEQLYFEKEVSTFYFKRNGKKCLLFTSDCVEWIRKQPQIDKFWE